MPKSWEQMKADALRRPEPPQAASAERTVRWGDEKILSVTALATIATGDLLNVELPMPAECRLWYHAEVLTGTGGVLTTSLELFVGNGSQTTKIRRAYNGLPAQRPLLDVPIDVTWSMPLVNIRGRVSLIGSDVSVRFALWLTPLVEVG